MFLLRYVLGIEKKNQIRKKSINWKHMTRRTEQTETAAFIKLVLIEEGAGNNVELQQLVSSGSISPGVCLIGYSRRRCRADGGKFR